MADPVLPTARSITTTSITVSYSGIVLPACGYTAGTPRLTVRVAGDSWDDGGEPAGTAQGPAGVPSGSLIVTGLTPGTAYEWRLEETGTGVGGVRGTFTTLLTPPPTTTPTTKSCTAFNGTVSAVTATSITFRIPSSTCVPQAIFYVSLFTSEATAHANTPVAASGNGSREQGSIRVTGLTPNTRYWYRFQMPAPAPVAGPVLTPPSVPIAACTATARIDAEWGAGTAWGGQIVSVVVRNTSSIPLPTWSVSWPLAPDQEFGNGWGARILASAGTLTATPEPAGPLPAGGTLTFGARLSGTGPVPTPACLSPTQPGRTVYLSEDDSGRTVTLNPGDTLSVTLDAEYDPISLSPASPGPLVPVTATGGYPTGATLTATYRATTGGPVDLRSTTDDDCLHAVPPCARPVRLWTVHVVVAEA